MDIKLNSNYDIDISSGGFELVDGLDAIRQELDISLQMVTGEWFLDTRWGMPWFQQLLGVKPRLYVISQLFREAIMAVNGIAGVNDLNISFDPPTRELFVSFRATALDGIISYDRSFIL